MHVRMRDSEGHEITIAKEHQQSLEAKGFSLVGDAPPLAEGALVGHAVRVYSAEDQAPPPGHEPKMVQATDGEQVIWLDAALTARFASFLARGFLPIPPGADVDQLESIKQEARAKKGAS